MQAQRHEVEAWVNPDVWEDRAEAQRVIDLIIAADSDDEAEWVRIAGGGPDDIALASEREQQREPQGNTPIRAIRISDDLWEAARQVATERGETLSEVVREALRRYVD